MYLLCDVIIPKGVNLANTKDFKDYSACILNNDHVMKECCLKINNITINSSTEFDLCIYDKNGGQILIIEQYKVNNIISDITQLYNYLLTIEKYKNANIIN